MSFRINFGTIHRIELLLLCNEILKSIKSVSIGSFLGKKFPKFNKTLSFLISSNKNKEEAKQEKWKTNNN